MQTVLDVDVELLNRAEQQTRRQGKSLGALVEDALRTALYERPAFSRPTEGTAEPVEADGAFFAALEEIRAFGRVATSRRRVELP